MHVDVFDPGPPYRILHQYKGTVIIECEVFPNNRLRRWFIQPAAGMPRITERAFAPGVTPGVTDDVVTSPSMTLDQYIDLTLNGVPVQYKFIRVGDIYQANDVTFFPGKFTIDGELVISGSFPGPVITESGKVFETTINGTTLLISGELHNIGLVIKRLRNGTFNIRMPCRKSVAAPSQPQILPPQILKSKCNYTCCDTLLLVISMLILVLCIIMRSPK